MTEQPRTIEQRIESLEANVADHEQQIGQHLAEAHARPAVASEGLRATYEPILKALSYPCQEPIHQRAAENLALLHDEDAGPTTQQVADSRWHELNEPPALASDAGSVGSLDVKRLRAAIMRTWRSRYHGRFAESLAAAYDAERQGE